MKRGLGQPKFADGADRLPSTCLEEWMTDDALTCTSKVWCALRLFTSLLCDPLQSSHPVSLFSSFNQQFDSGPPKFCPHLVHNDDVAKFASQGWLFSSSFTQLLPAQPGHLVYEPSPSCYLQQATPEEAVGEGASADNVSRSAVHLLPTLPEAGYEGGWVNKGNRPSHARPVNDQTR